MKTRVKLLMVAACLGMSGYAVAGWQHTVKTQEIRALDIKAAIQARLPNAQVQNFTCTGPGGISVSGDVNNTTNGDLFAKNLASKLAAGQSINLNCTFNIPSSNLDFSPGATGGFVGNMDFNGVTKGRCTNKTDGTQCLLVKNFTVHLSFDYADAGQEMPLNS